MMNCRELVSFRSSFIIPHSSFSLAGVDGRSDPFGFPGVQFFDFRSGHGASRFAGSIQGNRRPLSGRQVHTDVAIAARVAGTGAIARARRMATRYRSYQPQESQQGV
jgi:hypothetical protein